MENQETERRRAGTLRYIHPRGFGFIAPSPGPRDEREPDVFVYFSKVRGIATLGDFAQLHLPVRCSYRPAIDRGRACAVDVILEDASHD